ncbi:virulence factor Mce family protein [Candidatus Mycobacterium methanotrophicum]|uniref:Virulence factor Mce family protein n=1 Tax=Candidatus Mycobacterium methanotrophicum TaxID=2943498 RepID=A0ABY4QJX3_9MYCO|nr:virulence factor Mce family protein [Candidatus Mycobacterium methanotrophicum]UQX10886.1 virulence factor Mce family protein [Candidatus Mycobacterium methanotrophicum]
MSTVFDIRNLRLPKLSRASVIIGSLVIVLALVAAFVGRELYQKLVNNTVVAYFPEANSLYSGDEVRIMGIQVGAIDKVESAGDKMKVTFHYNNKYKVPANATAVILNPNLVAARNIQLEPPYKGGPVLADNAVIPIDRTQVPTEWDALRDSFSNLIDKLGPTPQEPKGPFGDAIEAFANGLSGKGKQINTTLTDLSQALTALNEGRGDFFGVARSLALFVNALHADDQQFVALNQNLAQVTDRLTHSDRGVANAIQQLDNLLPTLRPFLAKNREVLAHDVNNLADVTTTLVQPEPLNGLETGLHIFPTLFSNGNNFYHPANGALLADTITFLVGALPANPLLWVCGPIQAGSRLGYQDSAELCAQYLTPILDAIKFNYQPFTLNIATTAQVLPKEVGYSEPRLQPPNGYKDSTVPGIWVPDTPTSHRNTQHGWIVAPGMQGVQVDPVTEGLLTPDSLAELMGGPDATPALIPGQQTPPGPPNAYNEEPGPLPYVGQPPGQAPIPPPPPGPNVIPGPVPPTPAPVAGSPGPAPAPAGPPPPAEAASSAGPGQ